MRSSSTIAIFVIIILTFIGVFFCFSKKQSDDPNLSYSQNRVESQVGNGSISFNDPYEGTQSNINFKNMKGSVNSSGNVKGAVDYEITDILSPINLDSDPNLEYPIILKASYPDGKKVDYLIIARRDVPNINKYTSIDQVAIGDPSRIDDIHSLGSNEVIVDAFANYDDGDKANVILTYTFKNDKIVPGKDNIDINKVIAKQKAISPIPAKAKATSESQSKGKVALTFDDGPGVYTQAILNTLKQYDVKATFFMIGQNAESHPDLVKLVNSGGHVIGNHTYDHQQLSKFSYDKQMDEIKSTNDILKNIVSSLNVHWFRPPYGDYNDDTTKVLDNLGMSMVLWNVDPRDWSGRSAEEIANSVISNTKDGSIVLMHDGVANSVETAKALPTIIQTLKDKGFQLVTVSELKGYSK
jgi:peptidoglycan/xylan/chitin deacetylase (PgdA/CDA1 family)